MGAKEEEEEAARLPLPRAGEVEEEATGATSDPVYSCAVAPGMPRPACPAVCPGLAGLLPPAAHWCHCIPPPALTLARGPAAAAAAACVDLLHMEPVRPRPSMLRLGTAAAARCVGDGVSLGPVNTVTSTGLTKMPHFGRASKYVTLSTVPSCFPTGRSAIEIGGNSMS